MMEATQGVDIVQIFKKQIDDQKYLVFLQDLPSLVEWHAIRSYLPDRKNGSRIIISTHQLEIAILCAGKPYQVLELRQASADHSIYAFLKEGCQPDEVSSWHGISSRTEPYKFYDLITSSLDDDNSLPKVISMWGTAGVSKSAFVRIAFSRLKDDESYFDKYGWINVSCPFDIMDFSRHLLDMLLDSTPAENTALPATDPIQECRKLMHAYRCFVVIDGLQTKEDWDLIKAKLISENSTVCIIVIAMEESFATYCSASDEVFNMNVLEDEAVDLIGKAFPIVGSTAHLLNFDMAKEAKHFLYNYGGLPAVIAKLADIIADQQEYRPRWQLMHWNHLTTTFLNELETRAEFVSLRRLFALMHSHYHACPHYLKKCILYLSVLPQNSTIRVSRLATRWMAEGYSPSPGNGGRSLEDAKKTTISKVALLGMLQQAPQTIAVPAGSIISWQVNSLFLSYIISRQTEDDVFLPLEVSVLDGSHSVTGERVGQHLVIRSSWERDDTVYGGLDFSRLRSLTVSGEWRSFLITDKMRVLRVLDLEGTSNVKDADLEQIGKLLLHHLKFLSVRGCREISHLPDSMGGLRQLQTLDIRHTSVVKLPQNIVKLQKLQYVRAGLPWGQNNGSSPAAAEELSTPPRSTMNRTMALWLSKLRRLAVGAHNNVGVEVPKGIGALTAFHTLGVVDVSSAGGEAILRELCKLKQLRKLGVSGINRENSDQLYHVVHKHAHLESLSLGLEKDNQFVRWTHLSPPENMRSLKLYGHVEVLPECVKYLDRLVKLSLEMTASLTRADIQILGKLEKLHVLRLRVNTVEDGQLQFRDTYSSCYFYRLKILEITCKCRLNVRFSEGVMNELELLKIHCCTGASMQLHGLEHLSGLKEVWLSGAYDDALEESLQQQVDRRRKKTVLKVEQRSSRPGPSLSKPGPSSRPG